MSNRKEIRDARRKIKNRNTLITIGMIIGAIALTALVAYSAGYEPVGEIVVPTPVNRPMVDGNSMGNPDAPVIVNEYADFQCPACKQTGEIIMPRLINNYIAKGLVYFTYIPFSFLDDQGPGRESKAAAEAAYCAMEQYKFWEYSDILFANQTGENIGDFSNVRLVAFGAKIGLNRREFNSCLSSGKYEQTVLHDRQTGAEKGVSGTPIFEVNGMLVSANELEPAIKAILAGQ